MNEKLLEILINLLWPKILAAYGDQIQEAIKLAFSFKTFADELTARFERIENRLTNIENILSKYSLDSSPMGKDIEHANRRDASFTNSQLVIEHRGSQYTDPSGSINGSHAGRD